MDVTPHDLRNAELRGAFRGYRPDECEELLERAAITLERMHERNRQLQEKIATLEAEGSSGKEMESVRRQPLVLARRGAGGGKGRDPPRAPGGEEAGRNGGEGAGREARAFRGGPPPPPRAADPR